MPLDEFGRSPYEGLDPLGEYTQLLDALLEQSPDRPFGTPREQIPVSAKLQSLGMLGVPVVSDVAGLAGDAMMFGQEPQSRTPMNFGLSALGILPFIPGLTAFHGSPHRINNVTPDAPMGRFDLQKVGTGEGAQAYGHGIYLAESEGIARQYQAAVKDSAKIKGINAELSRLAKVMNKDEIPGQYRKYRTTAGRDAAKQYDELLSARQAHLDEPGNFYTVDLPDEHVAKMLDWDAPLSEQPKSVREALQKNWPLNKSIEWWDPSEMTGQDLHRVMTVEANRATPDYADTAKRLNKMGIPGIKYFDGSSRAAEEGTRNFVVFDPSITKIIGRE